MTEIETVKAAIDILAKELSAVIHRGGYENIIISRRAAIEALKEKLHRLENKPLTWEELQARIRKPVYCTPWDGWVLVTHEGLCFGNGAVRCWDDVYSGHGTRWQAYDFEIEVQHE